jgi:hypothetical protein
VNANAPVPSPPTITTARIAPSGEPELSCGFGPLAVRSTIGTPELVVVDLCAVVLDAVEGFGFTFGFAFGAECAVVVVAADPCPPNGASVVPGATGSVATVTEGGGLVPRAVGGGLFVVVDVVTGGTASDGETLGCARLPNANASIVPAFG